MATEQTRFAELLTKAEQDYPDKFEEKLSVLLTEKGLTVACAESITAGLVASRLTAHPGSSAFFLGGIVAYHARLKVHLLGIPAKLIAEHSAVSSEVALKMALNIRLKAGSDYGLGVVGYAGPQGGPQHDVGLIYVAIADAKRTLVHPFRFTGGRQKIREKAAQAVIGGLYWRIVGEL